ncbi:odorant receptor Or2-like [Prorops nasuta]|uniref:odorant receptor Or2-like n=1 Tax=Prorops nasuta TaxID=863751 RepID=UPI0034CFE49F
MYVQHACGMFAVLGYRLEQALPENILESCNTNVIDNYCKVTLDLCIERHQKAIEFAALTESFYSPIAFLLSGAMVLFLSLSLTALSEADVQQFRAVLQLFLIVGSLWVSMFLGQRLIDHSTAIAIKAYNYPWYICRPPVRKNLPLVMERASRACMLSGLKFVPLSLDSFRLLMHMGVSYYMVLRTV